MPLQLVAGAAGAILLIALPSWAQPRAPGEAERTGAAVALSVRDTPQLTVFDHVDASLVDGIVTLTGRVTDEGKRDAVHRRVAAVEGVREVRDRIEILRASRTDEDLRTRIARTIYGDARFWQYAVMPHPPIRIIVEDGAVTLAGYVRTAGDRRVARTLAMQSGARAVHDELKIR